MNDTVYEDYFFLINLMYMDRPEKVIKKWKYNDQRRVQRYMEVSYR